MANSFDVILYTADSENISVNALVKDESIWLSQKAMAEVFGVDRSVVTKHLKNIFEIGELDKNSVCANFTHTANDGKDYLTTFYNLDAIISVGYRVNSTKATKFRIWATSVLREFIIKGFTLDDERLKQGERVFGKDYFRELLERVRSIRASERRIWLKITDIFAECSTDYIATSPQAKEFFQTVQNKFHYAITGATAPEIIYKNADSNKANMGLTTWQNSPDGRILKKDVSVAKNYLSSEEIKNLELIVSAFFDYIELQIKKRQSFTMSEFALSVDKFLTFNEYKILDGKGKVSKLQADKKAFRELEKFRQNIVSDFEKEMLLRNKENI